MRSRRQARMTDTYWIVDVEVAPDQASAFAEQVKHWLIGEGVVLSTPPEPAEIFPADSPCYPGHLLAPGPKARDWCSPGHVFSFFSGLEIVTGKRVFDPGANFSDLIECPSCAVRFDSGTLKWMAAIDNWWTRDDGALTCPACRTTHDIGAWRFPDSSWAFGYLGFGFNEWDVEGRMVRAIGEVLRHRCVVVRSHI